MLLGMPYVELEVPRGTAAPITRFYTEIIDVPARVGEEGGATVARVAVGPGQHLVYRECDKVEPDFDGHHVCIYISDFSGPYRKLGAKGLISQEDDQHQYRFKDIVDPASGRVLFTLEHEVRSLNHPLYARPFVNRNPAQSNRAFAPGYEALSYALPVTR